MALVSTPDVAKDLFSGLWDQAADKELFQAYTNLDSCSRAAVTGSGKDLSTSFPTTTESYIPSSAVSSAPSPVFCVNPASPVSTGSTSSETSNMNTHPYYPGPSSSPLTDRYTQLALLLVSQSQGQALSREEEEKRRVRRERNKVAATKCREKRKAHSVYVRHEYSQVADTTKQLEDQINNLKQEREELMRILNTHECVNPELTSSELLPPRSRHQGQMQQMHPVPPTDLFIKPEPMYHH